MNSDYEFAFTYTCWQCEVTVLESEARFLHLEEVGKIIILCPDCWDTIREDKS